MTPIAGHQRCLICHPELHRKGRHKRWNTKPSIRRRLQYTLKVLLLSIFITGCAEYRPQFTAWRPGDNYEWHRCSNGIVCMEGYACAHGGRHGCEWCSDDEGIATRCTGGND